MRSALTTRTSGHSSKAKSNKKQHAYKKETGTPVSFFCAFSLSYRVVKTSRPLNAKGGFMLFFHFGPFPVETHRFLDFGEIFVGDGFCFLTSRIEDGVELS